MYAQVYTGEDIGKVNNHCYSLLYPVVILHTAEGEYFFTFLAGFNNPAPGKLEKFILPQNNKRQNIRISSY